MVQDHEVILIGTGVAPLVAASRLIAKGIPCMVLNPDADFFLEDSELPLDPWSSLIPLETVADLLRPEFPGSIETWSPQKPRSEGFHDENAPHLRARTRLWVKSPQQTDEWGKVEDLFLKAQDAGLASKVLEGATAVYRFPGYSGKLAQHNRAVSVSGLYDIDLTRYRNELLEYVRDRLGVHKVLCGITLSEWIEGGLRYYHDSQVYTQKAMQSICFFWTPRLSSWLRRVTASSIASPLGFRLWEEWSLSSREFIDPSVVGVYQDMMVYSDYEGLPPRDTLPLNRLKVLKPSKVFPWDKAQPFPRGLPYASAETLEDLTEFCEDFLNWDKFSIHDMKPRLLFEWEQTKLRSNTHVVGTKLHVIPDVEGPLHHVVERVLSSLERIVQ